MFYLCYFTIGESNLKPNYCFVSVFHNMMLLDQVTF